MANDYPFELVRLTNPQNLALLPSLASCVNQAFRIELDALLKPRAHYKCLTNNAIRVIMSENEWHIVEQTNAGFLTLASTRKHGTHWLIQEGKLSNDLFLTDQCQVGLRFEVVEPSSSSSSANTIEESLRTVFSALVSESEKRTAELECRISVVHYRVKGVSVTTVLLH